MISLQLAALLWVTGPACATSVTTPPTAAASQARLSSSYGKLPLSFEINRGQTDSRVKFLARGRGYGLFLTPSEAVLILHTAQAPTAKTGRPGSGNRAKADGRARAAVVRMQLAHANANPELSGLDLLAGTSNYFIGSDAGKWQTGIAHYARVKYTEVYPGVDLIYYGNQRQLEYDFVVAPGADPTRIEMVFDGVRSLSLDEQGNLILAVEGGDLVHHKPVVYQERQGQRTRVDARYMLRGRNRAGFQIASYDTHRPLVIDPVLSYSTYFGGSGGDYAQGIAVDASGNAYVTGYTSSINFPTTSGVPQTSYSGGGGDAFVTKLDATGTSLVYATYLGGSGEDYANGIALDAYGNAYVTGYTASSDFPTRSAYQVVYGANGDGFLTKLGPDGAALVYSTYLGGSGTDFGNAIALDGQGNVYVTGNTSSSDFPATTRAYQRIHNGGSDAFVTKLDANGSELIYSTYLGGSLDDGGRGIAVDAKGNAYITGDTASGNFPSTAASYGGGNADAYVTKLNVDGTALIYSTFLGGSSVDSGNAIALDSHGNAYVAGFTNSGDFPATARAYQPGYGGSGGGDAFVTQLNAAGTALIYSTYLGGSGEDYANGIALDPSGNAHVTGITGSSNFPTTASAYQHVRGGDADAFFTKLHATGEALIYSTLMGGSDVDSGYAIALDSHGSAYVTGFTDSSDFPATGAALMQSYGGGSDAFITKFLGVDTPQAPQCRLTASPSTIIPGQNSILTVTCSPAANSYAWTNTGFAATVSAGSVSPTVTTTYSVIGSNAAGSGNIATATVTVTPCSYGIPTSQSVAAVASTGMLSVTAPSGCAWTASSNADWITITSGSSGNGSDTVAYAVAANPGEDSRSGTLTIAGQTFTITQAGAVPAFISQSDCLFGWAERNFSGFFAPSGAISNMVPQLYFRHYSQTQAYLGTYSVNNHLYYLGPLSGNSVFDLGPLSDWISLANCQ